MNEAEYERRKAAVKKARGLTEEQYDAYEGDWFEGEREYLTASIRKNNLTSLLIVIGMGIALVAMLR